MTFRSAILCLLILLQGCGLTVTGDNPPYKDLEPEEQSAVDIIVAELKALDKVAKQRSKAIFGHTIDLNPVVDKERIHVSFQGRILALNVGDGTIHVATWENLTDQQRKLVQSNFKSTAAKAKVWFEKLFYRVLAVSNGIKQFTFNTPSKTLGSFSIFNMELHPMRTAMGYFTLVGRKSDIWSFTNTACKQVLAQGKSRFGKMFTTAQSMGTPRFPKAKAYMNDNTQDFFEGADPTATLYFICQWTVIGKEETEGFDDELRWLYSKLK